MKSISRRLVTFIMATAVVLSTVSISVPAYADTNNRTVKVGFFAYPGYHEINDDVLKILKIPVGKECQQSFFRQ